MFPEWNLISSLTLRQVPSSLLPESALNQNKIARGFRWFLCFYFSQLFCRVSLSLMPCFAGNPRITRKSGSSMAAPGVFSSSHEAVLFGTAARQETQYSESGFLPSLTGQPKIPRQSGSSGDIKSLAPQHLSSGSSPLFLFLKPDYKGPRFYFPPSTDRNLLLQGFF